MEAPPPSRRQDRARRAPRLPGLDEDDYEVTSVSGGGIDVGATVMALSGPARGELVTVTGRRASSYSVRRPNGSLLHGQRRSSLAPRHGVPPAPGAEAEAPDTCPAPAVASSPTAQRRRHAPARGAPSAGEPANLRASPRQAGRGRLATVPPAAESRCMPVLAQSVPVQPTRSNLETQTPHPGLQPGAQPARMQTLRVLPASAQLAASPLLPHPPSHPASVPLVAVPVGRAQDPVQTPGTLQCSAQCATPPSVEAPVTAAVVPTGSHVAGAVSGCAPVSSGAGAGGTAGMRCANGSWYAGAVCPAAQPPHEQWPGLPLRQLTKQEQTEQLQLQQRHLQQQHEHLLLLQKHEQMAQHLAQSPHQHISQQQLPHQMSQPQQLFSQQQLFPQPPLPQPWPPRQHSAPQLIEGHSHLHPPIQVLSHPLPAPVLSPQAQLAFGTFGQQHATPHWGGHPFAWEASAAVPSHTQPPAQPDRAGQPEPYPHPCECYSHQLDSYSHKPPGAPAQWGAPPQGGLPPQLSPAPAGLQPVLALPWSSHSSAPAMAWTTLVPAHAPAASPQSRKPPSVPGHPTHAAPEHQASEQLLRPSPRLALPPQQHGMHPQPNPAQPATQLHPVHAQLLLRPPVAPQFQTQSGATVDGAASATYACADLSGGAQGPAYATGSRPVSAAAGAGPPAVSAAAGAGPPGVSAAAGPAAAGSSSGWGERVLADSVSPVAGWGRAEEVVGQELEEEPAAWIAKLMEAVGPAPVVTSAGEAGSRGEDGGACGEAEAGRPNGAPVGGACGATPQGTAIAAAAGIPLLECASIPACADSLGPVAGASAVVPAQAGALGSLGASGAAAVGGGAEVGLRRVMTCDGQLGTVVMVHHGWMLTQMDAPLPPVHAHAGGESGTSERREAEAARGVASPPAGLGAIPGDPLCASACCGDCETQPPAHAACLAGGEAVQGAPLVMSNECSAAQGPRATAGWPHQRSFRPSHLRDELGRTLSESVIAAIKANALGTQEAATVTAPLHAAAPTCGMAARSPAAYGMSDGGLFLGPEPPARGPRGVVPAAEGGVAGQGGGDGHAQPDHEISLEAPPRDGDTAGEGRPQDVDTAGEGQPRDGDTAVEGRADPFVVEVWPISDGGDAGSALWSDTDPPGALCMLEAWAVPRGEEEEAALAQLPPAEAGAGAAGEAGDMSEVWAEGGSGGGEGGAEWVEGESGWEGEEGEGAETLGFSQAITDTDALVTPSAAAEPLAPPPPVAGHTPPQTVWAEVPSPAAESADAGIACGRPAEAELAEEGQAGLEHADGGLARQERAAVEGGLGAEAALANARVGQEAAESERGGGGERDLGVVTVEATRVEAVTVEATRVEAVTVEATRVEAVTVEAVGHGDAAVASAAHEHVLGTQMDLAGQVHQGPELEGPQEEWRVPEGLGLHGLELEVPVQVGRALTGHIVTEEGDQPAAAEHRDGADGADADVSSYLSAAGAAAHSLVVEPLRVGAAAAGAAGAYGGAASVSASLNGSSPASSHQPWAVDNVVGRGAARSPRPAVAGAAGVASGSDSDDVPLGLRRASLLAQSRFTESEHEWPEERGGAAAAVESTAAPDEAGPNAGPGAAVPAAAAEKSAARDPAATLAQRASRRQRQMSPGAARLQGIGMALRRPAGADAAATPPAGEGACPALDAGGGSHRTSGESSEVCGESFGACGERSVVCGERSGACGESSVACGESSGPCGESGGVCGESAGAFGESSGAYGESSGACGESVGACGECIEACGESSLARCRPQRAASKASSRAAVALSAAFAGGAIASDPRRAVALSSASADGAVACDSGEVSPPPRRPLRRSTLTHSAAERSSAPSSVVEGGGAAGSARRQGTALEEVGSACLLSERRLTGTSCSDERAATILGNDVIASASGRSAGPSPNSAGPSQDGAGTSPNRAGPSQDSAGPSQDGAGTSPNRAGPSQDGAGSSSNSAGRAAPGAASIPSGSAGASAAVQPQGRSARLLGKAPNRLVAEGAGGRLRGAPEDEAAGCAAARSSKAGAKTAAGPPGAVGTVAGKRQANGPAHRDVPQLAGGGMAARGGKGASGKRRRLTRYDESDLLESRFSPLANATLRLVPFVLGVSSFCNLPLDEQQRLAALLPQGDGDPSRLREAMRSEQFADAVVSWQAQLAAGEFDPSCEEVLQVRRRQQLRKAERAAQRGLDRLRDAASASALSAPLLEACLHSGRAAASAAAAAGAARSSAQRAPTAAHSNGAGCCRGTGCAGGTIAGTPTPKVAGTPAPTVAGAPAPTVAGAPAAKRVRKPHAALTPGTFWTGPAGQRAYRTRGVMVRSATRALTSRPVYVGSALVVLAAQAARETAAAVARGADAVAGAQPRDGCAWPCVGGSVTRGGDAACRGGHGRSDAASQGGSGRDDADMWSGYGRPHVDVIVEATRGAAEGGAGECFAAAGSTGEASAAVLDGGDASGGHTSARSDGTAFPVATGYALPPVMHQAPVALQHYQPARQEAAATASDHATAPASDQTVAPAFAPTHFPAPIPAPDPAPDSEFTKASLVRRPDADDLAAGGESKRRRGPGPPDPPVQPPPPHPPPLPPPQPEPESHAPPAALSAFTVAASMAAAAKAAAEAAVVRAAAVVSGPSRIESVHPVPAHPVRPHPRPAAPLDHLPGASGMQAQLPPVPQWFYCPHNAPTAPHPLPCPPHLPMGYAQACGPAPAFGQGGAAVHPPVPASLAPPPVVATQSLPLSAPMPPSPASALGPAPPTTAAAVQSGGAHRPLPDEPWLAAPAARAQRGPTAAHSEVAASTAVAAAVCMALQCDREAATLPAAAAGRSAVQGCPCHGPGAPASAADQRSHMQRQAVLMHSQLQQMQLQVQQLSMQQVSCPPQHVALAHHVPTACYPHYTPCATSAHPPHAPHGFLPHACAQAMAGCIQHSVAAHYPAGFAVPAPAAGQPFETPLGVAIAAGGPGACTTPDSLGNPGPSPLALGEAFGTRPAQSAWRAETPRQ